MDSNYILKISMPCSESWDKMLPAENGRYCASCTKNVIDFSKMSDREILTYFQKNEHNVCGRLAINQLNRPLVNPRKNGKIFSGLLKISAALFLATIPNSTTAQKIVVPAKQMESKKTAVEKNSNPVVSDSSKHIVKGRVLNQDTNQPLSDVKVWFSDSDFSVLTDAQGNFELYVPSSLLTTNEAAIADYSFYIHFEINGIETADSLYQKDLPVNKVFTIAPHRHCTALVGGISVTKRKWWQFWKKK